MHTHRLVNLSVTQSIFFFVLVDKTVLSRRFINIAFYPIHEMQGSVIDIPENAKVSGFIKVVALTVLEFY